jgi:hypothetical protein
MEVFTDIMPAITGIFNLGFIPDAEEICELTDAQYDSFRRQGGDITSHKIYTIVPGPNRPRLDSTYVHILTEQEIGKFAKTKDCLHNIRQRSGEVFESEDEFLYFLAANAPTSLSEGTKYEQPTLKLVDPDDPEATLSEREVWLDFLARILGEGLTVRMQVTDETQKVEQFVMPLENRKTWKKRKSKTKNKKRK